MTRRVMILKDTYSPLFFIRCAEPCARTKPHQDWCDDGSGSHYGRTPAKGYERGVCWLYSSPKAEACRVYAELQGWEIDDA